MAEIEWIKLYVNLFDNRKIKQIEILPKGDTLIVIWIKLLIMAGVINDGGAVYFTKSIPYTADTLATQLNRSLPNVQLALETFESFGMIHYVNGQIVISNWNKYQNINGMDKIKEQNRKRKQKQREKLSPESGDDKSQECHAMSRDTMRDNERDMSRDILRDTSRDIERDSHTLSRDCHATDKDIENKNIYITPIVPNGDRDMSRDILRDTSHSKDKQQDRFDRFWDAYPKKVGKGAAEKSFSKYKPDDELTDQMIQKVEAMKQTAQWQKDGGQYIPNPATWLNQKRWEDEVDQPSSGNSASSLYDDA